MWEEPQSKSKSSRHSLVTMTVCLAQSIYIQAVQASNTLQRLNIERMPYPRQTHAAILTKKQEHLESQNWRTLVRKCSLNPLSFHAMFHSHWCSWTKLTNARGKNYAESWFYPSRTYLLGRIKYSPLVSDKVSHLPQQQRKKGRKGRRKKARMKRNLVLVIYAYNHSIQEVE